MEHNTWLERIQYRPDITTYITHLTRENEDMSALEVLIKILNERTIIGSTNKGFINGNDSAVCFQEAPLQGIAQNVLHEHLNYEELGSKIRYRAYGIMFHKGYAFKKHARPVIYDTRDFIEKLPATEKWRFVTYDLREKQNIIDWTHEREWRHKGDFTFKYSQAIVLLPHVGEYQKFIKQVDKEILGNLRGIINLDGVIS